MALQKRGPGARNVRGPLFSVLKKRGLKTFLVYESKVITKKKVFNLGGSLLADPVIKG